MAGTVEIWDEGVELSAIFGCVGSAMTLKWSLMEIWAVGREGAVDVVALEDRASQSATGLEMSRAQLDELAAALEQVIDGIFVGFEGDAPKRTDQDLRETATVVIEAIDSTLWRVYSRDPEMVACLNATFANVRSADPDLPIRPSHTP